MTVSEDRDGHTPALRRAAASLRLSALRVDCCDPSMATAVRYDHRRRAVPVRLADCGDRDSAATLAVSGGEHDGLRCCGQIGTVVAFEVTGPGGHAALGCTCDAPDPAS